jgi:AraC-like DNA-binding protein
MLKAPRETVVVPHDSSFVCKAHVGPSFPMALHLHPEFELFYLETGYGTEIVGEYLGATEPGELLLVGPELPHGWLSHPAHPSEVRFVVAQFRESFPAPGFYESPELSQVRRMLGLARRGIRFGRSTAARVGPSCVRLLELGGGERLVAFLAILERLSQDAEMELLCSETYVPNVEVYTEKRVDRVYQYLFEHFSRRIKLRDVAAVAHLSETAFCRYFRQHTGRTFVDVLSEIRISHACRLLVQSDAKVAQICYESGFANVSNFNRSFLRFTGTTPAAYRSRYRQVA